MKGATKTKNPTKSVIRPRYWDKTGKYSTQFKAFCDKHIPAIGKADTPKGELARAVCKLYYRTFNDGDTARCFLKEYMSMYRTSMLEGPADERSERTAHWQWLEAQVTKLASMVKCDVFRTKIPVKYESHLERLVDETAERVLDIEKSQ